MGFFIANPAAVRVRFGLLFLTLFFVGSASFEAFGPGWTAVCHAAQKDKKGKKEKGDGPEYPSLKEALESELHAKKWKLRKKVLDAQYDFLDEDQALDFRSVMGGRFFAGAELPGSEVRTERGKLLFGRQNSAISLGIPTQRVMRATAWVGGCEEFAIVLANGDRMISISLEDWATITVDNNFEEAFNRTRTINLLPSKKYRVDVEIGRKGVVAKLDGRKVLEKKLPKDFPPMTTLQYSTGSSKAYLTGVQVRVEVSDDAGVVAVNRQRGASKKPPLWPEMFEAKGKHYEVVCGTSAETAEKWLAYLEAQHEQMWEILASDVAPPARPADGDEDGVDEDGDAQQNDDSTEEVPADKRARPLPKVQRKVYVFTSTPVLEAYSGRGYSHFKETGELLIANQNDAFANSMRYALFVNAYRMVRDVTGNGPYWWHTGLSQYFSIAEERPTGIVFGGPEASYVTAARKYLEGGSDPRLSDLLAGKSPGRDQRGNTVSLVWAWVSFLINGGEGAHLVRLQEFASARRHGEDGESAGELVFPVTRFNELFPEFESYLGSL